MKICVLIFIFDVNKVNGREYFGILINDKVFFERMIENLNVNSYCVICV